MRNREERGAETQSHRARVFALDHALQEVVDGVLAVAEVAAVHVVAALVAPAAVRVRELERPEEARRLPEVRSAREDLVHQVLHAHHVVLLCEYTHSAHLLYSELLVHSLRSNDANKRLLANTDFNRADKHKTIDYGLTEALLDDGVVGDGNSLAVHLREPALVDQRAHC